MKVNDVIETIISACYEGERLEQTGDIIVSGHGDQEVTGIVTTFMATVDVIKEAVRIGANLIITHEPTYFNGRDQEAWLAQDEVYKEKKRLLETYNITIWRFHDYMHLGKSDLIYDGIKEQLNWTQYQVSKTTPWVYEIPEVTLENLVKYIKDKLEMPNIRVVGDLSKKVSRIGILVGGGSLGLGREEMPIEVMSSEGLDVMLCGEIVEWTLCAYINDAQMLGLNKSMIVLGHERSEEWGMSYLATWCKSHITNVPIHFVDAREPFKYC